MAFLSRLILKLAYWLSPLETETFQLTTQSKSLSNQEVLERLSSMLSSLLNTAPSSIKNSDTSHQLKLQLENQRIKTEEALTYNAQAQNLPHRIYPVGIKFDGLEWIAFFHFNDGGLLVGRGPCPASAFNDFDEKWLGIKE